MKLFRIIIFILLLYSHIFFTTSVFLLGMCAAIRFAYAAPQLEWSAQLAANKFDLLFVVKLTFSEVK